jgi:hypothetical protein
MQRVCSHNVTIGAPACPKCQARASFKGHGAHHTHRGGKPPRHKRIKGRRTRWTGRLWIAGEGCRA